MVLHIVSCALMLDRHLSPTCKMSTHEKYVLQHIHFRKKMYKIFYLIVPKNANRGVVAGHELLNKILKALIMSSPVQ